MKPFLLKACSRCHGDLVLEIDEVGYRAYVCLQCGRAAPAELASRDAPLLRLPGSTEPGRVKVPQ